MSAATQEQFTADFTDSERKNLQRIQFLADAAEIKDLNVLKEVATAREKIRGEQEKLNQSLETYKSIKLHCLENAHIKANTSDEVVHMIWHDRLRTDIEMGRTVGVRGPAGNGKSTGVKAVLEGAGFNIYHLDCTDSTTNEQLVGGMMPEPDGLGGIRMVFAPGIFNRAFEDEKAAVQLDEFDALDPRVAMCLQSALHRAKPGKSRMLSVPDHPTESYLQAKGPCPIVVTMNTWGAGATSEYVGRNALDAASMDRFEIISTSYENENSILTHYGLESSKADTITALAKKFRDHIQNTGMRIILSTRRLITIGESCQALALAVKDAYQRDFLSRLPDEDSAELRKAVAW